MNTIKLLALAGVICLGSLSGCGKKEEPAPPAPTKDAVKDADKAKDAMDKAKDAVEKTKDAATGS